MRYLFGILQASKLLFLIGIVSVIVIAEGAILVAENTSFLQKGDSFQEYADQVLEICSGVRYTPSCYDEEIPKLLDTLSLEETFQVARIVQERDSLYGYCHVLGHNISAIETAKDPEKWVDVIRSCPTGICSNGCLHGAALARFRSETLTDEQIEELKPELLGLCESGINWNATGLEAAECYHGLGHLSMYVTNADIPKSISLCDAIAVDSSKNSHVTLCYEGAFMQLFQPLDEEDFALVEGIGPEKKEDLRSFCEQYEGESRIEACWQEGWPLFRNEVAIPEKMVEYCSMSLSDNSRNQCYNMLFYVKAQGSNYDSQTLSLFCLGLPSDITGQCFGNMANAMIHGGVRNIEKAVAFCSLANNEVDEKACQKIVSQGASYNVQTASEDFSRLCAELPDAFKDACIAQAK